MAIPVLGLYEHDVNGFYLHHLYGKTCTLSMNMFVYGNAGTMSMKMFVYGNTGIGSINIGVYGKTGT